MAFIEAELKAERERRTGQEARGQALITTSGALVTLLVGVAAVVKTAATLRFPPSVSITVGTALLLFAVAAGCGVAVGWNRHYAVAKATTLTRMLTDHWTDDEVDARNHVATLLVETLGTLRRANELKARWVLVGLVVQVVALIALCAAAITTVANA
ncbi:hypothetical protein PV458_27155 [Streptomyces sp. MN03-5084-2B]|nr:hypothetical protein [Streptomyces sp. MN03-5084-2B]